MLTSTPLGSKIVVDTICRGCEVQIRNARLLADLIVLELEDLDVILGMDWLSKYRAVVNCFTKEVVLETPDHQRVSFSGER